MSALLSWWRRLGSHAPSVPPHHVGRGVDPAPSPPPLPPPVPPRVERLARLLDVPPTELAEVIELDRARFERDRVERLYAIERHPAGKRWPYREDRT